MQTMQIMQEFDDLKGSIAYCLLPTAYCLLPDLMLQSLC